jgi:hypothetical protein
LNSKTNYKYEGFYFEPKIEIMAEKKDEKDPCWKNYEQVGMKTKDGKKVPNCVPKESKSKKK